MIQTGKRLLAAALLCALLLGCTACGGADTGAKGSDAPWFPYGLQFGQSYDEVEQVLRARGLVLGSPESSNIGAYQAEVFGVAEFDWSFLRSDTLTLFGSTEDFQAKLKATQDAQEYERLSVQRAGLIWSYPRVLFLFESDERLSGVLCIFDCSDSSVFELMDGTVLPESTAAFAAQFGTAGKSGDSWSWEKKIGDTNVKVMIEASEDTATAVFGIVGQLG